MRKAALLVVLVAGLGPAVRGGEGGPPAPPAGLDLQKYIPVSEIRPGMVGIGKTTLEGTAISEFSATVRAVLKNVLGPKQDVILIQCHGAGLEQTGVIAGMSGSPVYLDGRLAGAVAFAFPWAKLPIAGVQPIEQMLAVTDEHPWAAAGSGAHQQAAAPTVTVPVAALGLAQLPAAPAGLGPGQGGPAGAEMQPIRTPVTVSGAPPRALERLQADLAAFGMTALQGGSAAGAAAPKGRLEAGAPLAIQFMRGDLDITAMGTITHIAGDRLYGFGHAMFGAGKADFPLMTGVAHVVIPSMASSFRLGMPSAEVGRLSWDESAAVFGRLRKDRAPMVPVAVTVHGPDAGQPRSFHYEMVRHRLLSPILSAVAAATGLEAHRALPEEHTVAYRVAVKAAGLEPVVQENLAVTPSGADAVATQARSLVGLLMNNPFRTYDVESVRIEARVEAGIRLAEVLEARALSNAVRPGTAVRVQVKVKPWRKDPEWLTIPVAVPADYPNGSYRLTFGGADDAVRQEMAENPARFRMRDAASLVRVLRYGLMRDRMYVRLEAPGEGIAVEAQELPDLPPSMRTILAESAPVQPAPVRRALVTERPMPYVLTGSAAVQVTVDRRAAVE